MEGSVEITGFKDTRACDLRDNRPRVRRRKMSVRTDKKNVRMAGARLYAKIPK